MEKLPDLDRLSHAEKNDLIRALFAQVRFSTAQVTALTAGAGELEGRLAQNSHNSNLPPSTGGMRKPKSKSEHQPGQHPSGGQKECGGHNLKSAVRSGHIENHRSPSHQVFDIPALRHEVTEHRVAEIRCICGKICRGEFPEGVTATVQYGSRIKAAAVQLT